MLEKMLGHLGIQLPVSKNSVKAKRIQKLVTQFSVSLPTSRGQRTQER